MFFKKTNNRPNARELRFREEEETIRTDFDSEYYLAAYPDVKNSELTPLRHFVEYGWKEGRNPNASFDTRSYILFNRDIGEMNPFVHYVRYGRAEGRLFADLKQYGIDYVYWRAAHRLQDINFPTNIENAERLIVIVVPEHNAMSGGIYSFFSIARTIYQLRSRHGFEVVLMTAPNSADITYLRQKNFRNSEDVFRFEQLERCSKLKVLQLHVPEYMTSNIFDLMKSSTRDYIRSREHAFINILNQNIRLMPEKSEFIKLWDLAEEVTQSVAHHAYFKQCYVDRYNLPTLLLPAFTDISEYECIDFAEKEDIIIYSPDEDRPYYAQMVALLKEKLPDYELIRISGIRFDEYMSLAGRCRFSVSLGEGFDGYLAQPSQLGGVGFAVYQEEFFPFDSMKSLLNIFRSEEDALANIIERIRALESDEKLYRETNASMVKIYDRLYSKEDYRKRILKLVKREFELIPNNFRLEKNNHR